MLVLRVEELELQGFAFQAASQMAFNNTIFTKGQSFSQQDRQEALATCNKYLRSDILCLIVESEGKLTLWRESKDLNLPEKQLPIPSGASAKYQNPILPFPAESEAERQARRASVRNSEGGYAPPLSSLNGKIKKSAGSSLQEL
ncbi:hypothetical protein [Kamptonema formosum]|uniref:hypothetical protein n=1 Tax=Kamptonema formosum TaxID=331992 RepID=UPI0003710253|nr:hypothetical protein [Oscillatoria sp. PCC 10802]